MAVNGAIADETGKDAKGQLTTQKGLKLIAQPALDTLRSDFRFHLISVVQESIYQSVVSRCRISHRKINTLIMPTDHTELVIKTRLLPSILFFQKRSMSASRSYTIFKRLQQAISFQTMQYDLPYQPKTDDAKQNSRHGRLYFVQLSSCQLIGCYKSQYNCYIQSNQLISITKKIDEDPLLGAE